MYIQGMSTCAIQEMVSIRDHSTPEEAMKAFCRQTLGDVPDVKPNGGYGKDNNYGNKGYYAAGLGENYVFCGVEDYHYKNENEWKPKIGYASRLAAFIVENKLGHVAAGLPVTNWRYHPDHVTKAFIFNPDREAVKVWWSQHGGPTLEFMNSKIKEWEDAQRAQAAAQPALGLANAVPIPMPAAPNDVVVQANPV